MIRKEDELVYLTCQTSAVVGTVWDFVDAVLPNENEEIQLYGN